MVSPFLTGEQTEDQITANIWLLKKGRGINSIGICGKSKVKKKSLTEQELNQSSQILILGHIFFSVAF